MSGYELELVEWLQGRQPHHPAVMLGVGDDMALVRLSAGRVLVASDMLLDGVHFDTSRHELRDIGRKAIACNISDCAAMAVRPVVATVSIALPADMPLAAVKELFGGMFAVAEEFNLAIVGGDTTSWSHPLAIDVAVTAEPFEGIEPVTRHGAQPGDNLYVTGVLGGSLVGRHLTFKPRVEEARAAAKTLGWRLHALMDISDGLSIDLWRMIRASGVGAVLDEQQLEAVISGDARQSTAADGRPALDHALSDGEDYELLLAVAGDADVPGVALHPVGVVAESDLLLQRRDGRIEPLEPKGWLH